MRDVSRVGVLLAAVALLLAGCGTDGEGAEKDATAGSSARELAGQLVGADDLGAGWTVLDPPEDYGDVGVVTDKNRGMVPRLQFCGQATSVMALAEIPQGCSSVFPTLGRCHCSGRRVPVAA